MVKNRGDLECERVGVGERGGQGKDDRGGVLLNGGKPLLIGT